MTDDDFLKRLTDVTAGLPAPRGGRSRGFASLILSDPSWIEPGASLRMFARPHARPFRASRISTEVRLGQPSLDYFRHARRADRSRRRGQIASQTWAAACLRIQQHPERFPPLLSLDSLIIARLEQLLAPAPLMMFGPGSEAKKTEVVLSICPAGQDICATVKNLDMRPARVVVVLIGREP